MSLTVGFLRLGFSKIRAPSWEIFRTTAPLSGFLILGHVFSSMAISKVAVSFAHTIKVSMLQEFGIGLTFLGLWMYDKAKMEIAHGEAELIALSERATEKSGLPLTSGGGARHSMGREFNTQYSPLRNSSGVQQKAGSGGAGGVTGSSPNSNSNTGGGLTNPTSNSLRGSVSGDVVNGSLNNNDLGTAVTNGIINGGTVIPISSSPVNMSPHNRRMSTHGHGHAHGHYNIHNHAGVNMMLNGEHGGGGAAGGGGLSGGSSGIGSSPMIGRVSLKGGGGIADGLVVGGIPMANTHADSSEWKNA
ncbi:hypothetical protein HDU76_002040 [Blyttiomyces sp. JEL0837]|nr:hypothetical protein HDU76_002040 [Blyttiomyces sp. JEL0837]